MSYVSKIQTIYDAVVSIKNALIRKGSAPSGGIETYSDAIDNIIGGGGTDVSDTTATSDDVVAGKVFHTSDGKVAEGSITDNRNKTIEVADYAKKSDTQIQIRPTFDGGMVVGDSTSFLMNTSTKLGNATADTVLSGYTFTSADGVNLSGSVNNVSVSMTSATFHKTEADGRETGSIKVTAKCDAGYVESTSKTQTVGSFSLPPAESMIAGKAATVGSVTVNGSLTSYADIVNCGYEKKIADQSKGAAFSITFDRAHPIYFLRTTRTSSLTLDHQYGILIDSINRKWMKCCSADGGTGPVDLGAAAPGSTFVPNLSSDGKTFSCNVQSTSYAYRWYCIGL